MDLYAGYDFPAMKNSVILTASAIAGLCILGAGILVYMDKDVHIVYDPTSPTVFYDVYLGDLEPDNGRVVCIRYALRGADTLDVIIDTPMHYNDGTVAENIRAKLVSADAVKRTSVMYLYPSYRTAWDLDADHVTIRAPDRPDAVFLRSALIPSSSRRRRSESARCKDPACGSKARPSRFRWRGSS